MSKKSNLYLIISLALALGMLADYLFYQKSIGVSFFAFNLAVIIFSLILAKRFEIKINKAQIFILIAVLLFSAGMFLRASSFLGFFNFCGSVYLLFFFFSLFLNKNILNFSFLGYIAFPIFFFLKSFRGAARFVEKHKNKIPEKNKIGSKEFRGVIKGIIIAAPFLVVLLWLLSSADLVFQAYLGKIFNFNLNFDLEIILRALIILVVSYLFLGVFFKITEDKKTEDIKNESEEIKPLGFIESSTILILVELLFLVFIAVQFFYLFGGKDYVWGIEEYITYSQYAKKGFYKLIAVSIVSFLLVYGIDILGKRESSKEKKTFKILGAALVLEISIIIYSAWTRMAVYVDGYGLTFSRFLVFALLLWIFSVFMIFLYKIISEKQKAVFLFAVFCLSIIFWTGINLINPDGFIAKENIKRLTQRKELDLYYLNNLSTDAIPETVKIFKIDVSEKIKMEIARDLYYRSDSLFGSWRYINFYNNNPISFKKKIENAEKRQNENWQSFNLSKRKALESLRENYKEIAKYQTEYFKKEAEDCRKRTERCDGNFGCGEEMCEMYEKSAEMEE